MKYPEITFQTVLGAIRHQWKVLLVSVVLFTLLGVGTGFAFAEKGAAPDAGEAVALEDVSFDSILPSAGYYERCKNSLIKRQKDVVDYIQQVSADHTITKEQRALLNEQLRLLQNYKDSALLPLQIAWLDQGAIYIPEEFIASQTALYESRAASTRLSLIRTEAAVELLKTMDSPDAESDKANNIYSSLLSDAAKYGSLKVALTKYEAALSQLKDHTDEVIAQSHQMEQQLNAAKSELNQLQEELSTVLDTIARENHLLLNADFAGDKMAVTITHTHDLATSQEAFEILVIFCCLTGICLGLFLAVCQEAKHGKKPEQG